MFIRNVYLSSELHDFVLNRIDGGRYSSMGEMVQAALHALAREERRLPSPRVAAFNASGQDLDCVFETGLAVKSLGQGGSGGSAQLSHSGGRHLSWLEEFKKPVAESDVFNSCVKSGGM